MIDIIASLLTGVFASLGLGGGMVLIIYLTLFKDEPQIGAQGINLLFFIPIAALSLIMHTKNRLVEWKKILPSIACGIVFAILGTYLSNIINSDIITKIFAVMLVIVGVKEIMTKKDRKEK